MDSLNFFQNLSYFSVFKDECRLYHYFNHLDRIWRLEVMVEAEIKIHTQVHDP